MRRELSEVVVVDAVRTPFGKSGEKGIFWKTRADDLMVAVIKSLLERNPEVKPEMVEDSIWGATTQIGEQGSTIGRVVNIAGQHGIRSPWVHLGSGLRKRTHRSRIRSYSNSHGNGRLPHRRWRGTYGASSHGVYARFAS